MEIDKSIGQWNLKNPSKLDDYAFSLYLYDMSKKYNDVEKRHFSQELFKYSISHKHYYDDGKLIIRKDKIEKILNHGKTNR